MSRVVRFAVKAAGMGASGRQETVSATGRVNKIDFVVGQPPQKRVPCLWQAIDEGRGCEGLAAGLMHVGA